LLGGAPPPKRSEGCSALRRRRHGAEGAAAINALAGARAGGELSLPRGLSDLDLSRCSEAQLRTGRRLRQGVVENFPPPGDLKKEEALKELLHADDLYAVKRLTALAAYDPTKLRVTKADLAPKEIEDLVSPEARALAEDPDKFIIKDDAELADDVDHGRLPGRPCWDPVLRHNLDKKKEFLKLLHHAGLLTWRRRSRCRVGCFFVETKGGMIRLVVDARWVNALCRPPPHSRLAVPSALARLSVAGENLHIHEVDLAEAAVAGPMAAESGTEDKLEGDGVSLVGFGVDLTDGFYQFKSKKMASFFGLDFCLTAWEIEAWLGKYPAGL